MNIKMLTPWDSLSSHDTLIFFASSGMPAVFAHLIIFKNKKFIKNFVKNFVDNFYLFCN